MNRLQADCKRAPYTWDRDTSCAYIKSLNTLLFHLHHSYLHVYNKYSYCIPVHPPQHCAHHSLVRV